VATAVLAFLSLAVLVGGDPVRANDADKVWIAEIDLGVDVSEVAKTEDAFRGFLERLDAKTERVVMNACEHYVAVPDVIIGPDTLTFCSIAVIR
jgi:hypothetical protein